MQRDQVHSWAPALGSKPPPAPETQEPERERTWAPVEAAGPTVRASTSVSRGRSGWAEWGSCSGGAQG